MSARYQPRTLPLLLLLLLQLLQLRPSLAASVLKYNVGGLAVAGYQADPIAFLTGVDLYYRPPGKSGLTVGNTHRWAGQNGFAYAVPTGPGNYTVQLVFAEIYAPTQAVGMRVFDVAVQDKLVLQDFDVFSEAGANKELVKTFSNVIVQDGALTIACMKGLAENPMLSAIIVKKADGTDISIAEPVLTGEGVSTPTSLTDKEFDHQAHAVAGDTYLATDFNNDGQAEVDMDGTLSHSHYNNPTTGESGYIAKYEWTVGTTVISTKSKFTASFGIGVTDVKLTVTDQTGDVASAFTQVKVSPATAGGAYCYYYFGATKLAYSLGEGQKPDEGHASNIIDFQSDEFPYTKKDDPQGKSVWGTRCVTYFSTTITKQHTFSITYQGGGAVLVVNGVAKVTGGPSPGALKTISAVVTVPVGNVPVQVIYYKSAVTAAPWLTFLVDSVVAPPSAIGYRSAEIVPAIAGTSTPSAPVQGGGQLQIIGTGFFNGVSVSIGSAKPTFTLISATQLVVNSIPSAASAGGNKVSIVVSNSAGSSNAYALTYNNVVKAGVAWEQTFLKTASGGKYNIKQVSSVAIGPDAKYYMGSLAGIVYALSVDKNLVVTGKCNSAKIGDKRTILGIAFNPKSPALRVFVSSSSLYWAFGGGPFSKSPAGWANGGVDTLVAGCGCLCYESQIVSGLPVSNHDHGINNVMFLNNGDLLIAVGGATNAGHNTPGNKLGGKPESPLSGAIVIAKLSKGAAFNGKITYNQYANPATAVQTGGDVSVYASGMRNCFGMALRTNGQVWATDNGPNIGYGDISTSCTSQVKMTEKKFDELNLIIPGGYYGHPNRNRKECVYGAGVKPKATVSSSTSGIVEYTSNVFQGDLKGELILSKYAASGSGKTWRTKVQDNNVNLIQMAGYSGINVINGLYGELVMPRVQQGFVAVLKPKYAVGSAPFVIAVTPRRGVVGSQVYVSGENFAAGAVVKFGGAIATVKSVVGTSGIFVTVPAGSGAVSVVVSVGVQSSTVYPGYDFIYV